MIIESYLGYIKNHFGEYCANGKFGFDDRLYLANDRKYRQNLHLTVSDHQ